MNPYTTRTQARIQPRDLANATRMGSFFTANSLVALERQRGCQAEAEMDRLLKEHGVPPVAAGSLTALLRQTLGAALVRVGERLAGVSPRVGASTGGHGGEARVNRVISAYGGSVIVSRAGT